MKKTEQVLEWKKYMGDLLYILSYLYHDSRPSLNTHILIDKINYDAQIERVQSNFTMHAPLFRREKTVNRNL